MLVKSSKFPVLVCVALVTAGCGGKNDNRATEAQIAQPVSGSVVAAAQEISQGRFIDDCYRGAQANILEIAQALDARTAEIRDFSQKIFKADRSHRMIQVGSIIVREPIQRARLASAWKSVSYDWAGTYRFFKEIENKTVDEDWVQLNGLVRGLLSSEESRVVDGWDFADGRNSAPRLKSVYEKIDRCHQDPACLEFDLSDEDRNYILRPSYFTSVYGEYQKEQSREKRRKWIELLRRIVLGRLQSRAGFRVNPAIRQTAPGRFEVDVHAGDLENGKFKLAQIVESFWTDSTHQIRLRWQPRSPSLYRILTDLAEGGRAYVQHVEKAMHLYSGVRTPVVAHEFGHIFGFVDYYYETWDPQTCSYTSEWDEGDLMSNSSDGSVLPSHWERLDQAYPLRKLN